MQRVPLAPKRVLLVDDSETQLTLMQSILRGAGYELDIAHDGMEAVEQAIAHPPALILMDVEMPVLNGFEACRRLRTLLKTHVPIIFVTSRSEPAYVREGFEAGADGYLTKPVRAIELLARVRNYLGS
jgi:two-component system, sensor histidine kinase and response regulator